MGDSPTSTPAMKAPSTVRTPRSWVISAKTAMMTRITVMTGKSLRKVSLAQRMAVNTSQRPAVKQKPRNSATPATVLPMFFLSWSALVWLLPLALAPVMPKMIAMITQPQVASMMAVVTITWPRLRRMKFISRTTMATILIEEIESAVPRNSEVARWLPPAVSPKRAVGPYSPNKKPQAKGKAMPQLAMAMDAHPDLRTRLRSDT